MSDLPELELVPNPNRMVTLATGEKMRLASLYELQPLALVFVRHFACPFCREHVTQLRTIKGRNVVVVARSERETTRDFAEKLRSSHRFIADVDGELFADFGLASAPPEGATAEPRLPTNLGSTNEHVDQLGGTFIITPRGAIVWSHRSTGPSDNAPVLEIDRQLLLANQK